MMDKTVITIAYLEIILEKVLKQLSNKNTAWIHTSTDGSSQTLVRRRSSYFQDET
jgi:hypothetical protein